MKILTVIILMALLTGSCVKNQDDPVITELKITEKSAKIIEADNKFGLDLFRRIELQKQEGKNTMISPMSVSLALAMLYNGADGNTKKQMEEMLNKAGMSSIDINNSYKDLVAGLTSQDPKVELSISNAIFYRNSFPVKPDFISTNKTYYNAEISGIDFTKSAETLSKVNNWVLTNTKGKIDKIIEQVKQEDVMYLLNAIYFNGEWKYTFDTKETSNRAFTKSDKSIIQVPTMSIEKEFQYSKESNFELLELLYGSGKYSMLILLPDDGKNVDEIIKNLTTDNLNIWTKKMTEQKKKVYLPKFEFKYDNSLKDELNSLGMTDAFNEAKANLTGISDAGKLFVSEVMHKSYIKVDERGTEAAAVTGITVGVTSVGPDLSFRVDRPFIYLIREKTSNTVLFIGKVVDPSKI